MNEFDVVPVPEDMKDKMISANQELADLINPFIQKHDPQTVISSVNFIHAHLIIHISENLEQLNSAREGEIKCFSRAIDQFNPFKVKNDVDM